MEVKADIDGHLSYAVCKASGCYLWSHAWWLCWTFQHFESRLNWSSNENQYWIYTHSCFVLDHSDLFGFDKFKKLGVIHGFIKSTSTLLNNHREHSRKNLVYTVSLDVDLNPRWIEDLNCERQSLFLNGKALKIRHRWLCWS